MVRKHLAFATVVALALAACTEKQTGTGGALPAALAANWLAGAWDQDVFTHRVTPAPAVLEEIDIGGGGAKLANTAAFIRAMLG